MDGRESDIPNDGENLKEISRTLSTIASLDMPSQLVSPTVGPPLLTPTPSFSVNPSQPTAAHSGYTTSVRSTFLGDVDMSSQDEAAPGGTGHVQVPGLPGFVVSPGLSIDIPKFSSAKRPAPPSSPNPIASDAASKFPRHSDSLVEPEPIRLDPTPPVLVHSHSFPSAEHQLLPSEEEQQTFLTHTPQPRPSSSLAIPMLSSSPASPDSLMSSTSSTLHIPQHHASIVPSPLAISSSRPPSPSPVEAFSTLLGEQPLMPDGPLTADDVAAWNVAMQFPVYSPPLSAEQHVTYPSLDQPPPPPLLPPSIPTGPPSYHLPATAKTRPSSRRSSTAEGRPVVRLRGNTMGSDAELPNLIFPPAEQRASHAQSLSPATAPYHESPNRTIYPSLPSTQHQQQIEHQPASIQQLLASPQPLLKPSLSRQSSMSFKSPPSGETSVAGQPIAESGAEDQSEHEHELEDSDDEREEVMGNSSKARSRSKGGNKAAHQDLTLELPNTVISEELKAEIDGVFNRYLIGLCNNRECQI